MRQIHSKDENRKNKLSLEPGGSIVSIHYNDGVIIHYDKIKNVQRYVAAVDKTNANKIIYNTETLYTK